MEIKRSKDVASANNFESCMQNSYPRHQTSKMDHAENILQSNLSVYAEVRKKHHRTHLELQHIALNPNFTNAKKKQYQSSNVLVIGL